MLLAFICFQDIDFVLNLLEIENQEEVRIFLRTIDDIILVVPPLIMWITVSFGVLFWFMFLTLAFVMLGVASRLWEENKPAPSYNQAVQQTRSHMPATAPVEMVEHHTAIVHQSAVRYNDPALQPNEPIPYHHLPPSMIDVRRTIEPLKSGHEPMQNLQVSHIPLSNNNNNYPNDPPSPLRPQSMVNPYTDKRFSYAPGNPQPFSYLAGPPQHASPRSSSNLPEIRKQLPWSYFPPVEESAMPRRVTSTLTEHKEFPGQEISAPIAKPGAVDDRSSDEGSEYIRFRISSLTTNSIIPTRRMERSGVSLLKPPPESWDTTETKDAIKCDAKTIDQSISHPLACTRLVHNHLVRTSLSLLSSVKSN